MKRMIGICLILSLLIALSACGHPQSDGSSQEETAAETKGSTTSLEKETDLEQETMGIGKDKLLYMGQASIRITTAEGKVIYIDPYVGNGYEPAADLILVTHSHYDHNGVNKVVNRNPDCRIITWKEALEGGKHQTFDLGFVTVEAVKAGYNRWHSVKECVGYIITLSDGISVYVTGDTSKTEQMPELAEKHIDYAFYCCDGIFNMDLDEAAECARLVGAQHDIPYHVLAQDGVYFDRDRAEQFESPNLLIIDEGEEVELTGSSREEKKTVSGIPSAETPSESDTAAEAGGDAASAENGYPISGRKKARSDTWDSPSMIPRRCWTRS
ncbi:MAG: MBL fold metallo-hydrolase [Blautia sp.]|nr:MBL fold metallo-hydrolase [Blautia sp.]